MSAEYRAFVQLFGDLHTGIREGLDPLVQEAFSKGLICEGVYHGANDNSSSSVDARTRKFLNGVKDRVRLDRTAFDDFADLLFAQTGMEFLADRLRKSKSLPPPPEQETSRDYESIVRSGPARPTYIRRCYSPPPNLQRMSFDDFSSQFTQFSLQLKGDRKDNSYRLAVGESKQLLMSPPPKAVPATISTLKVDKSPDSLHLTGLPAVGKQQTLSSRFQRSTSLERMSELTPVKAELPQIMKTTPTPTTSPPAYSNPGPVKPSPKPCDDDQLIPAETTAETSENDETLELPTDGLRPRISTSSSVESSLEFSTPMSTPPVFESLPPNFCPGTQSVNPVRESQPTASAAAITIAAAASSSNDSPQSELPSPSVCPHFQRSMELAVEVKGLEKDLQGCFQREQETFERHASELKELNQENYALKQRNEHLQKQGEFVAAQAEDLSRKVQEQRFELRDLKRELETHQAKAKGFEYVLKAEKLEQQLHEAHELLSAMRYNNSTGYGY